MQAAPIVILFFKFFNKLEGNFLFKKHVEASNDFEW